jgi:DNA-binding transcriptional LysR family regulator
MRRLPSLNGLRAFEAAARHGSFVAAGQELNVTQAAISRMVRLLEARLGFPLFERLPNGLVLTAQARALQPNLTAAFDSISSSVAQVSAMRTTPVLTIGVGPSFATRWMIPRLASFYRAHPEIEVRLATGGAINPFRDDWTCGILLGGGDWPELAAEPLFSADLFPVCAASIARRLGKPSDLLQESLLQVVHSPEDWPLWLSAAGRETAPCRVGAELCQLRNGAAGCARRCWCGDWPAPLCRRRHRHGTSGRAVFAVGAEG